MGKNEQQKKQTKTKKINEKLSNGENENRQLLLIILKDVSIIL